MSELQIDLRDERFQTDRYAYIEELRAQSFYGRTADGAVVFFNQPDVLEVFRCIDFQFAFNHIDESRSPYLAKAIKHELLNMHGAAHKRLSMLVKKALRDRVIEGMREKIAVIVDGLIDAMPDDGDIDFCAAFADPLPARVLGPVFGIPYEDTDGLNEWIRVGGRKVDALQSGVGLAAVEDANRNIHSFLRQLIAERRDSNGDDLFSELMRAEIDGDRMSEDELVYLAGELASAGVDTTRAQLPLIVNMLLAYPEQMKLLRDNPELAYRTVDEGMRFAPLPWAIPHRVTKNQTYKGIELKNGDDVFVMIPAANRDPDVIDRPNEFDITRDKIIHFAFGAGMHSCPGSQLAKMEMAMALKSLVSRLPVMERASDPEWEPGQKDRTLRRLPIRIVKNDS